MDIRKVLFEKQDKEYALFQAKLTPTISADKIIGVRIPIIRKIAKEYIKEDESKVFLDKLPHEYYDENILHGLLISLIKDMDRCIEEVDKFLPYVDNWAVCDTMSPQIFKKNKIQLMDNINRWTKSKHLYTARFGLRMLMCHFLDDDFKKEYLDIAARIKTNEYYLQMMIAWFYATALAKQWESSLVYLEEKKLDTWIHNKTIQKACESSRITKEQKEYLKKLKIKG